VAIAAVSGERLERHLAEVEGADRAGAGVALDPAAEEVEAPGDAVEGELDQPAREVPLGRRAAPRGDAAGRGPGDRDAAS
jgi:hypothetical protein